MRVSLIYAAGPRTVHELALDVPPGCTVGQALALAGWLERFPEILAEGLALCIWNRGVDAGRVLREDDRVEVVRPLRVDPKVARRERFVGQGARGTGLFARRRPGSKAGY